MNFRFVGAVLLSALSFSGLTLQAQRNCGQSHIFQTMQRDAPTQYQRLREHTRQQVEAFVSHRGDVAKGAAYNAIPVVFHFVLTTAQWNTLGRDTGIRRRVLTQLDVLNEDFNRGNADSTLIPGTFKAKYADVGIRFALANTWTMHTPFAGIEIRKTPLGHNPIFAVDDMCYKAKRDTDTGLAGWDPKKYLNIWVCNISTSGGAGIILGVTTPPSFEGTPWGSRTVGANEIGIVLNNGSFGRREFESQYFIDGTDKGRTCTHEVGHFFELYHTWGDDQGLGSGNNCPGDMQGSNQIGYDDDISDTPPEANEQVCRNGVCPTYPVLDKCSPTLPGVMFMNYMDYVDDKAMQMFTTQQAVRMNVFLQTESSGLIQHPELTSVKGATAFAGNVRLLPNPASGKVRLSLDRTEGFRGAQVVNMMGQSIARIPAVAGQKAYDFNLSNAPRGIYFVQCQYDAGTLSQKLILE